MTTRYAAEGDAFPTKQLFVLALYRLAEPIALTSILPYAFPLVKRFHIGHESDASLYAGFLICAFALAESFTGFFWGALSDRVGRKPIVLFGCVGTVISLLLVGFASNIWIALAGRVLGGFLNGNAGVVQTMVGEIVKNPDHEPRAYAVMPFVWSVGTIIGPAIGGTLANPSVSFPHLFSPTGLFGVYPYLLPNLVCAGLLLVGIVVGHFFLEETHPDYRPLRLDTSSVKKDVNRPILATAGAIEHAEADLRAESYGTFNTVEITTEEDWLLNSDGSTLCSTQDIPPEKTFTKRVIMLVVAFGLFTYHSMTYDHLLPVFLEDHNRQDTVMDNSLSIPGGLGLSTQTVGLVMSVNGLTAIIIQAVIFPLMAEWLGVYRIFIINTVLHPIAYFVVPFLAFLPDRLLFPGIYACLTIRNLFAILSYPVILILLKEAAPHPLVLGKINGLAASAGAACRTIAPPVAGYLYSVGARHGFTGLAWWGSGAVAIIGGIQCFFVEREKHKHAHVHAAATTTTTTNSATTFSTEHHDHQKKGLKDVHITVTSIDEDDSDY